MRDVIYLDMTEEEIETARTIEGLARMFFPNHYVVLETLTDDWCWASFMMPL
jgi:hypothetical protein